LEGHGNKQSSTVRKKTGQDTLESIIRERRLRWLLR